jgi:hypothetical protein
MKKSYSELLLDPRWQKKRLQILERDKWTCVFCGNTKDTLHVHHLQYTNNPWDVNNKNLLTLCKDCHDKIHSYGNFEIVSQGALSPVDFVLLDPMLIISSLCYLENHKGWWIIQFRNTSDPYQVIKVVCMLYDFIKSCDNNIKIKIDEDGFNHDDNENEVYDFLSEINRD